jgi:hypothetical protein
MGTPYYFYMQKIEGISYLSHSLAPKTTGKNKDNGGHQPTSTINHGCRGDRPPHLQHGTTSNQTITSSTTVKF